MFSKLKISTAILIGFAFVFRILFANIGLFSTLSNSQTGSVVKSHFSTVIKKRRGPESYVRANAVKLPVFEACEEDADEEEDFIKAGTPLLIIFFSTFLKGFSNLSVPKRFFEFAQFNLQSRKYLALSILRI